MKLKLVLMCLLFSSVCNAQRLSLVGSNFSFAKGNIDVEVLTEIIQVKQDEVMERVFRNLIIDNFRKATGAEKSFATYSYIYNTLHTLTVEKNKTVITRQIINNFFEYSLVYGFTREFISKQQTSDDLKIAGIPGAMTGNTLLKLLDTVPIDEDNRVFLKDIDENEWLTFNILLDMAYDLFIKDESATSLHKKGLFKLLIEKPTLKKWYEQDNAYLNSDSINALQGIREQMAEAYSRFKQGFGGEDLINVYKELQETEFKQETITETQYKAVKRLLRLAIKSLKTYSDNNLIGNISDYLLEYTLIEFAPANTQGGTGSQPNQDTSKRGILYIDAEGLISNLYDKYASNDKRSTVSRKLGFLIPRPFFNIGATYSGALDKNNELIVQGSSVSSLNSMYFASEKIGLKFTFIDRKYTHSFEPGEEFKYFGNKTYWVAPKPEPIISRYELYFYGSGLLYNIVDIKSQENFNYALAGGAFGITFFNGLMLNAGVAAPIGASGDVQKNLLYTVSFDVPIIEYITAVRNKRNKS